MLGHFVRGTFSHGDATNMICPEDILDLNIARYSVLILAEKEPQMLKALREALDRDLRRKEQLATAARKASRERP